jgi:acetyltransferase-like isoleucine patch superfamily enzyme
MAVMRRIRWWYSADRIGPDMLSTHWMLFFPRLAERLCKRKFARFGLNAEFRPGAYAVTCSRIYIGDNVTVRPGSVFVADRDDPAGTIVVENGVLLGAGVHIYTTNHIFEDVQRPIREQGFKAAECVCIKAGAWIGANAVLLPGVTVGRNAVIGAGSVVARSIPDFAVAVGAPCRVIKNLAQARMVPREAQRNAS